MPKVESVIEIDSPSSTVWRVLTDLTYLPKLYSDVITIEMNPPGPASQGQKVGIVTRMGQTKRERFIEFTRVETEACLVSRAVPDDLFNSLVQTVNLTPMGFRTTLHVRFEYEFSPSYIAVSPDFGRMERLVADNLRGYCRNLKEICELMPLPS